MFDREVIKSFEKWFYKEKRKPLVIKGARQVGKTVVVTLFGKRFFNECETPIAVRIYSGNLFIQEIERPDVSKFSLLSLPFYLVYRLEELLSQFL